MESVFSENEIMVAEVRSKTGPKSVNHLGIQPMPEVGIEVLLPIEEIQYIFYPI